MQISSAFLVLTRTPYLYNNGIKHKDGARLKRPTYSGIKYSKPNGGIH